jgi:CRP-like cAMP-binding protein
VERSDQAERVDTAEFLRQTGLFSDLTEKEISSVLSTAREREFSDGDVIIREGPGGAGFYLMLDGSVEVRKGDLVLATFGPGDYFGEMALLLEDTPRTADVVATSATRCLVITPWDLKALITAHPGIGVKMMGELAKRLRDTDQALSE